MRWSAEKREIDELRKMYAGLEKEDMSVEQIERLKKYEPELWWRQVTALNLVRCSNCGGTAVRVGSNFRIPKKTDEKGWREVEEMFRSGEDMVAKFSFCSTIEGHEEMVEEAQMRLAKKETEGPWLEEKRRRIVALGLRPKD